jgi:hypothetical protein
MDKMKQFLQQVLLGLLVLVAAGCSNIGMPVLGDSVIHVAENRKINSDAQLHKNAAAIRVGGYIDARNIANPRKIGVGGEFVSGIRSRDIVLDQDVAAVVTNAMKTSLGDAGFPVKDDGDTALFELSGTVKALTYDVKARDEVSITIESTLKEAGSGKVVWHGIVTEKKDRFAGVSGNNKKDVADYLRKQLGVVTDKTVKAISDSLVVAHAELFNLAPGSKPVPGVTLIVAPSAVSLPNAPALPAQHADPAPSSRAIAPPPAQEPRAMATSGLFMINTKPARAKVYLDGVYYGLSPLRLEMEPGVHALSVKMEGYKTVDEKVSVRKGDSTEMDLIMER